MQQCLVFPTRHVLTKYINTHYNLYTTFKHKFMYFSGVNYLEILVDCLSTAPLRIPVRYKRAGCSNVSTNEGKSMCVCVCVCECEKLRPVGKQNKVNSQDEDGCFCLYCRRVD